MKIERERTERVRSEKREAKRSVDLLVLLQRKKEREVDVLSRGLEARKRGRKCCATTRMRAPLQRGPDGEM